MKSFLQKGSCALINRPVRVAAIGLLSLGCAFSQPVEAQTYPSKPIKIIVAGGGSSSIARLLATRAAEQWNNPVVVEDRQGASGLIAMEALAKSAPDGYTLHLTSLSTMLVTLVHQRLLMTAETQPVTRIGPALFAIGVNNDLPLRTIEEWIAYAKARPGKLAYGSPGLWSSPHVCMEAFNARAGISLLHVPYKVSTEGNAALMKGEIQAYCLSSTNAVPLAKGGKVRLIGSAYSKPSDLMPGVPPIAEKLPGFEVVSWSGIFAPARTPKELVSRIGSDWGKVIRLPDMRQRLANTGIEAEGTSAEEFAVFINQESERWGRILKERGAKPGDDD